jgi:hypothetical protein
LFPEQAIQVRLGESILYSRSGAVASDFPPSPNLHPQALPRGQTLTSPKRDSFLHDVAKALVGKAVGVHDNS